MFPFSQSQASGLCLEDVIVCWRDASFTYLNTLHALSLLGNLDVGYPCIFKFFPGQLKAGYCPGWCGSWLEHHPVNQKVMGSIPGPGMCLGCGPGPQLGGV